ncbi:MAG: tripartite tricarboxylate transporter TctB family protein [Ferrovibrio sp.]|uniref:tripartite tricarboxylate transporter TctB family protein n=1 Tax=Ferrovibrio sp. TaxID=1917215 RepID=UPI00260BF2DB|nr:tripartite tricarboxylate transporter TctB family protein [Ferrovibrio sp.]MCW0234873.1 tripartite tricarboxylate transporter TctB family protein [Ferrovibrio sp.]
MDQTEAPPAAAEPAVSPRVDFWSSFVWIALGLAIAAISLGMDRMERFQASIYTAPGLVPGLLGLAIALMGAILLLRAVNAGALRPRRRRPLVLVEHWRLIFSLGLSLVYALVIVASALPFWLVTAVYVTTFVIVFQYAERRASRQVPRGIVVALVHGLLAGLVIQYAFEELFLVRLP